MLDIRSESVGSLIEGIAGRNASPGGGSIAGLQAAFGACLLRMVANYSQGPRLENVSAVVAIILCELEVLETRALEAADEEARAFDVVGRAYTAKTSRGFGSMERAGPITRALDSAADAPASIVVICGEPVALAEELAPVGNQSVIARVAAAAASMSAAVSTSVINLESNVSAVKDPARLRHLERILQNVSLVRKRAEPGSRRDRVGHHSIAVPQCRRRVHHRSAAAAMSAKDRRNGPGLVPASG